MDSPISRDVNHRLEGPRRLGFAGFLVGLILALALARGAQVPFSHRLENSNTPNAQPEHGFDRKAACEKVVEAHNRIRTKAKLPVLTISAKLQAAAERHALDMAANEKMTHKGSDGTSPMDRIKAEGYDYRRAGENVAAGLFTNERLMKGWMDSPPHKRNILGSYSQIGVACATSESGKRYWCVTFGLPIRR